MSGCVLEKHTWWGMLLRVPWTTKEIKPVNPKGNQSWIFIGRTDAEMETPVLWPPNVKNWLTGKAPDSGKHWRQEEKGVTEDEMVRWHHRLNGQEFEWTPGVGDGQGGLGCYSPWGRKESDITEWLNWTELNLQHSNFLDVNIKFRINSQCDFLVLPWNLQGLKSS